MLTFPPLPPKGMAEAGGMKGRTIRELLVDEGAVGLEEDLR